MITNNRQLQYGMRDLQDLQQALNVLKNFVAPNSSVKQRTDENIQELTNKIEQLNNDIEEYKTLRDSQHYTFTINRMSDLLPLIRKMRMVRGISQEELANTLGVTRQQIQRWEAREYTGLGFAYVCAILEALDVDQIPLSYEVHKKAT